MPYPYPNYVRDAIWDDPKKTESRNQAIVLTYRKHFGQSLPNDKQYWTMCGAYYDANNNPIRGELGQLLKNRLIKEHQFFGVDKEEEIISKNKTIYPNINWILGDFKETMEVHSINGNFNPAIINYDGVMGHEYGAKYLKKIMKFLDCNANEPLLLVANFILNNPYKQRSKISDGIDVMRELKRIYTFPIHWKLNPQYYIYNGTGKRSRSYMGTFIFIKEAHQNIIAENGNILLP